MSFSHDPSFLPETRAVIADQEDRVRALSQAMLRGMVDGEVHPQIMLSALSSTLLTLLSILDIPEHQHATLRMSVCGLAQALQAFGAAPDHATAAASLRPAADAMNRAHFERIDVQVATRVTPRG